MSKLATGFIGVVSQMALAVVFLVSCDGEKRRDPPGGASGGSAAGPPGGTSGAAGMGAAGGAGGRAPTNGTLALLAGGAGPSKSVDGVGQNARFSALSVIAFDGAGSLYAIDGTAIRRVGLTTGEVTTLGQVINDEAQALAADGRGNVYYTRPPYSHVVKKLDITTGRATVVAGSGQCGEACGTSDGVGTQALFNRPAGLALDGTGKMFVAEASGQVIRMIDLGTLEVTTLAGMPTEIGHTDGIGTAARFWQPWEVALDSKGNLFVTDLGNGILRKIVLATKEVTTLTASGFVANAGGADVAKVGFANGLTVDGGGNLYVGVGDVVQKIVPATGQMTTVVGAPGQTGVVLGPLPGSLTHPTGLAALPDGRLLIASENMILVATF